MKSASKAAPGEITRKFLTDPEQHSSTKQAYHIHFKPAIEYDEKGNVVSDDKGMTSDPLEEGNLKSTLDLLSDSLQLARTLS